MDTTSDLECICAFQQRLHVPGQKRLEVSGHFPTIQEKPADLMRSTGEWANVSAAEVRPGSVLGAGAVFELELQDEPSMGESVRSGHRGHSIFEDLIPLREHQVRRQHQRSVVLVSLRDEGTMRATVRVRRKSMGAKLANSIVGMILAAVSSQALALQTRAYVVSWFVPAMYSHEGDCKALEPVADPGRSPIDSMYRRILLEQGKTPEEADKLLRTLRSENPADLQSREAVLDMLVNRGRVGGEPVNANQNPESVSDPNLNSVVGQYAIGFNLDGQGAGEPGSFEDPYTHEQGVDNQFYRASGCFGSARAVSPERSGHWANLSQFTFDRAPAVLISVTGEDLSQDGPVSVSFHRTIERIRIDASGRARRDMTFRLDPNPNKHSTVSGRIENGAILLEGGHVKFEGRFGVVPFDLTAVRMRLKMATDGSVDGYLAGYHPWRSVYHFYYSYTNGTESVFGINLPGIYYLLKKHADADPDPVTGQNRRISITYYLQAVPAFVASPSEDQNEAKSGKWGEVLAYGADQDDEAPLKTPMGVTIQVPNGGGDPWNGGYRERSVEQQYYADDKGMALYTYDHDLHHEATCYDACAREWPPLRAPKGARAFGDWTLVRRRDGAHQWAYRGQPLYRFAGDTVIGEATGVLEVDEEKADGAEAFAQPPSPWKLASYKLADIPSPPGITVAEVADANGEVLVDARGRTLYTFNGPEDRERRSCRAAPCASAWIPLAAARLANSIGDFTLIERSDGLVQWAYKGQGLYTYAQDLKAGDAKGVGVDRRWRAARVRRFYWPPGVRIQDTAGRGKVLADQSGMTLYRRSAIITIADLARSVPVLPEEGRVIGTRSCDAQCMQTWRPFEAPADAQSSGFWAVLHREDGRKQWSYKGYALYRYTGDKEPGDVLGTMRYQLVINAMLDPKPNAVSQLAGELKVRGGLALVWSHMYP